MSSSSNAPNANILPPASTQVAFWDDDTISLNPQRLKQNIPELPKIEDDLQVVRGGGIETLAYMALQVVKTNDKLVVMRAIASASACLLQDSANLLGSTRKSEILTGLEVAADPNTNTNQVLKTNFIDESDVTVGELLNLMDADGDEIGSFFGVLYLAGNKKITEKNRSAFNEKRASSATASIIGPPKIFVTDSIYLADEVMAKVYASFLSCTPLKAVMTARIVNRMNRPYMGPALAFMTMFALLQDQGMSAMRIIKEAVLKHPWIRTEFNELKPEFAAANNAQQIIKRAPGIERSFLKAIHGNSFVPVNYSEIDNLTGVCKEILKRTTPSYQNYDGGKVTAAQLAKINSHADVAPAVTATVAAE